MVHSCWPLTASTSFPRMAIKSHRHSRLDRESSPGVQTLDSRFRGSDERVTTGMTAVEFKPSPAPCRSAGLVCDPCVHFAVPTSTRVEDTLSQNQYVLNKFYGTYFSLLSSLSNLSMALSLTLASCNRSLPKLSR